MPRAPDGMDADSERLFTLVTAGDRGALEQMLARYLPQLCAFLRVRLRADLGAREASMDVVQSVCRRLLAGRRQFEFRGEERGSGFFRPVRQARHPVRPGDAGPARAGAISGGEYGTRLDIPDNASPIGLHYGQGVVLQQNGGMYSTNVDTKVIG